MANIASKEEAPQHVFGNGVFWKTLDPLEEPIKEPTVGSQFHQPTSNDVPVVEKRNYSQTFDWAPFIGFAKVWKVPVCVISMRFQITMYSHLSYICLSICLQWLE